MHRLEHKPKRQRYGDDGGFSLVETLTSIAIMGVVMTALTTFFVSTTNVINKERGLQMAIRLAHNGIELVRSLPGPSLVVGRSALDVNHQFDTDRVARLDLAELRTTMTPAVDPSVNPDAASVNPVLPVAPEVLQVNDATFERHWFVGTCAVAPDLRDPACTTSQAIAAPVPFYRVVVAVTWQNSRACAGGECSYITDTLVAAASGDPVFNPSVTLNPPQPDNPGNQVSDVMVEIAPLTLTASTSNPPITWRTLGLPPGLAVSDAGVVTGTPQVAGTYPVRATVTDAVSTGDAVFTWIVNPQPAIPQPPDQTWDAGAAVSYIVPLTGGTAAFAWTATGLPAGLSIAPTTGVITGRTEATGAAATATVTVTDRFGERATATFKWFTRVAVQSPSPAAPIALTKDEAYNGSIVAAGGSGTYTFSSPNLPPGLTMTPAGAISGTPTAGTRFLMTINVTDSLGATNSTVVPVTVDASSGLRITAPPASQADRTATKGRAISPHTTVAVGGATPYVWSANLPPGIELRTHGHGRNAQLTGTPTAAGTYVVTMTVTDETGATAGFTFVWEIS
jgi:prepilin-type N-terminal cleavage/methylation domain-containing protein